MRCRATKVQLQDAQALVRQLQAQHAQQMAESGAEAERQAAARRAIAGSVQQLERALREKEGELQRMAAWAQVLVGATRCNSWFRRECGVQCNAAPRAGVPAATVVQECEGVSCARWAPCWWGQAQRRGWEYHPCPAASRRLPTGP